MKLILILDIDYPFETIDHYKEFIEPLRCVMPNITQTMLLGDDHEAWIRQKSEKDESETRII